MREATPEKVTVVPKRSRRVLIWNTPYMEESLHKGYAIPQSGIQSSCGSIWMRFSSPWEISTGRLGRS